MNFRAAATAMRATPPTIRGLAYAGIAFLVGAITQLIQSLPTLAGAHAFSSWQAYLISLIIGAATGGLSAALPYLMAMLPAPEPKP